MRTFLFVKLRVGILQDSQMQAEAVLHLCQWDEENSFSHQAQTQNQREPSHLGGPAVPGGRHIATKTFWAKTPGKERKTAAQKQFMLFRRHAKLTRISFPLNPKFLALKKATGS